MVLNESLRISICLTVQEWCAVQTALDEYMDTCTRSDAGVLVGVGMQIDKRLADIETALQAMQPALPLALIGEEVAGKQLQA